MTTDNIKNIAVALGVIAAISYARKLTADPLDNAYDGEIDESYLSFPMPVYAQVADALEFAFWQTWWAEDEGAVVSLMQGMQNNDDVLQLSKVYGRRCRPKPFCSTETLYNSITRYLEPEEIQAINADYIDKGITVQF